MKKNIWLITIALILYGGWNPAAGADYPNRIVSMSPAITEILYELKLGDNVAGVTDYCNFPEDAKTKTRTGGYLNPNYEAIYSLKADLVIMPSDYGDEVKAAFDRAKIRYITVNMLTVKGIFNSIGEIGRINGKEKEAALLRDRLQNEIDSLKKKAEGKPSKRVMIVVGRQPGSFDDLYIAGKGTFYDGLLNVLGCENAYSEPGIKYPSVSVEAIMRLVPDVIIEVLPGCPEKDKPKIISEWRMLDDIKAVKNDKVYVLSGDYVAIPGPRFTLILRDIEEAL